MTSFPMFRHPASAPPATRWWASVDVPPPTPNVVPPPTPDVVPRPMPPSPTPIPPEIQEPSDPGQNEPVREPILPASLPGLSTGRQVH